LITDDLPLLNVFKSVFTVGPASAKLICYNREAYPRSLSTQLSLA
jgi:hypothetical protein